MHASKVLLFASFFLPIIGAPVGDKEVVSIQQRSADVFPQQQSQISKREPMIESIPTKALDGVVVTIKRDADTEDSLDVRGEIDDEESEENGEDDEEDESSLEKRGRLGGGGHKMTRGRLGGGGHKMSRGRLGGGGHKMTRGRLGGGGHKLRRGRIGGSGHGDKRGLVQRALDYFFN